MEVESSPSSPCRVAEADSESVPAEGEAASEAGEMARVAVVDIQRGPFGAPATGGDAQDCVACEAEHRGRSGKKWTHTCAKAKRRRSPSASRAGERSRRSPRETEPMSLAASACTRGSGTMPAVAPSAAPAAVGGREPSTPKTGGRGRTGRPPPSSRAGSASVHPVRNSAPAPASVASRLEAPAAPLVALHAALAVGGGSEPPNGATLVEPTSCGLSSPSGGGDDHNHHSSSCEEFSSHLPRARAAGAAAPPPAAPAAQASAAGGLPSADCFGRAADAQRPRPSRARQGPSTTAHYQWRYRTTTAPPTSPLPPLPAPVQRFVRRPTACPPGQRRPPDRRQPTPTQGSTAPPRWGGGGFSAPERVPSPVHSCPPPQARRHPV
jgi:hypothetical protein